MARRGIRSAFEEAWRSGQEARRAGDLVAAKRHLVRAHVIGQHITRLHARSHIGFLLLAWQRRDMGEVVQQAFLVLAALVLTWWTLDRRFRPARV